ncbi:MAG: flagellin, partial [Selenomonadaceae bacterium]|nr:flagellin [Selenomonadaceae bacterium]
MAMTVMHNNAAQMTLGELQKNSNSLSKKLQQVASGMKINGAGDGAAEYAISERMQVSLRAL